MLAIASEVLQMLISFIFYISFHDLTSQNFRLRNYLIMCLETHIMKTKQIAVSCSLISKTKTPSNHLLLHKNSTDPHPDRWAMRERF